MHKFSLYEHEVSPLMDRLDAVGEKVNWLRHVFSPRRTLLIIDMQNDFISGSLAVDGAADIISPIADLIEEDLWNQVIHSQDWHPADHISFFSNVDLRPLDSTWEADHPGKVSMFEEVVFKRYPPYAQVLWPDHCVQGSDGAKFHSNITNPKKTKIVQKGTNPMIDSYSAFFDNTGIMGSGSTGLRDMARPVKAETGEDMLDQVRNAGGQVTTWNSWQNELDDWQRAKDVAEFFIANTGVSDRLSMLTILTVLAFIINM